MRMRIALVERLPTNEDEVRADGRTHPAGLVEPAVPLRSFRGWSVIVSHSTLISMAELDPAIQTFCGSLALAGWMATSRAAMDDKAMIQCHQIVL